MIILAIETSCDDTSLAIFQDDVLLSMDTKSQIKIHNLTGGVVPEIAAREHANVIFDVLDTVLQKANVNLDQIDAIWVTTHPWLIPSLLTWVTLAKTLWKMLQIPVHEINHIQAHIFANFLERKESEIVFPLVCLTVSWGHNDIYFMENMWHMQKIGTSWDDAAGESYDKVAKMMWLWYPGWPIISQYASEYSLWGWNNLFPRVWLKKDEFDFSFSWLKSSVKREIDSRIEKNLEILKNSDFSNPIYREIFECQNNWQKILTKRDIQEISYEFQNAVNEVLAFKLIQASKEFNTQSILLAGWVSANDNLREKISIHSDKLWKIFLSPVKKVFCMDNAAMIWILTYYKIKYNK